MVRAESPLLNVYIMSHLGTRPARGISRTFLLPTPKVCRWESPLSFSRHPPGTWSYSTMKTKKMEDMYAKVINSSLHNSKLKMYFLSGNLTGQTFNASWLENQSIQMPMFPTNTSSSSFVASSMINAIMKWGEGGCSCSHIPQCTVDRSWSACQSLRRWHSKIRRLWAAASWWTSAVRRHKRNP